MTEEAEFHIKYQKTVSHLHVLGNLVLHQAETQQYSDSLCSAGQCHSINGESDPPPCPAGQGAVDMVHGKGITLVTDHILEKENVIADTESRVVRDQ